MKEFIGLWPIGFVVLVLIVLLISGRERKPAIYPLSEEDADILKDAIGDGVKGSDLRNKIKEASKARGKHSKMVNHVKDDQLSDHGLSPKEKKAFKK